MNKSNVKKKICVVTGTRAEYGLLKLFCLKIKNHPDFQLQLVVTGSHLSALHGNTFNEIEADGFKIDQKIDLKLESDTPTGIARSTGIAVEGFAKSYEVLKPDIVVILGDRYELLGAAIAALFHGITVAHIHGGETTEGAIDESIRHCLTKLSHLHFVAADEYRRRVMQLGEDPAYVFNVGGLGVDAIRNMDLLDREAVEQRLRVKFKQKNLLITFHPETLAERGAGNSLIQTLEALSTLQDTLLIFTLPNADTGHQEFFRLINDFVADDPENRVSFESLGQGGYFSCLQFVDGVIGNSSSGLLEAPTFRIGTINIGDRQKGRLRATSVIDCEGQTRSILQAIERLYSNEFRQSLSDVKNPYGEGGASDLIVELISGGSPKKVKKFIDISETKNS